MLLVVRSDTLLIYVRSCTAKYYVYTVCIAELWVNSVHVVFWVKTKLLNLGMRKRDAFLGARVCVCVCFSMIVALSLYVAFATLFFVLKIDQQLFCSTAFRE